MSLREFIVERASNCCEYCQTSQLISGAQMHLEHTIPVSKGGETADGNLCLSCAWCNSYKGVQTEAIDPKRDITVKLFNPRLDRWEDHFKWNDSGILIKGISPVGRATVGALKMNNQYIVPARRHWVEAGWHPPKLN